MSRAIIYLVPKELAVMDDTSKYDKYENNSYHKTRKQILEEWEREVNFFERMMEEETKKSHHVPPSALTHQVPHHKVFRNQTR